MTVLAYCEALNMRAASPKGSFHCLLIQYKSCVHSVTLQNTFNQVYHLINNEHTVVIYCFNCIRRDRNAMWSSMVILSNGSTHKRTTSVHRFKFSSECFLPVHLKISMSYASEYRTSSMPSVDALRQQPDFIRRAVRAMHKV